MSLKTPVKILIITVILSVITITFAESAQRMAPTAPPATAILGSVGSDFIVADERKFMITSKTVIKNRRGRTISHRVLKLKSKLKIEFIFVEKEKTNVPVATTIEVVSEP